MRLIDADIIGLSDFEIFLCGGSYREALKMLINKIETAPTIEERKVGHWIEYIPEHGKCSFCGNQVDLLGGKINNFCGECGADMRGVSNERNDQRH